ncbi:MAG: S8 family serine peptidase [Polyangiaceae bacterium]|nr:S8 family serine peptidase [Polyangiaceae bacterium]
MRTLRSRFLLPSVVACFFPILPIACQSADDSNSDDLKEISPQGWDETQEVDSKDDGPIAGRIIVKFAPSLASDLRKHLAGGGDFSRFSFPEQLAQLNSKYSVAAVRPVFRDHASDDAIREQIAQRIAQGRALDPNVELPHLQDIFEISFDPTAPSTRLALEYTLTSADVIAAEPLFPGVQTSCPPSEPLYGSQWAPPRIEADIAWCSATGAGQSVAVIDTGIDNTHPDLAGQVDNNGFDCVGGPGVLPSFNGAHGTEMAGIIGADFNGVGMAGMAPDATLVSVNVTDPLGIPDPTCTASGIQWASSYSGILNISLAFRATSFLIEDAIAAAHALDAYMVASSGNDTSIFAANPGYTEWVTTVGASTSADTLWPMSNTGSKIDVVGPGDNILSTTPGGGYVSGSGTSAGTAHVSGLVALLREVQPTWNVEQIRQAVRQGADDANGGGFDTSMGHGRINANKSVQIAQSGIPRPTANIIAPKFDKRIKGKTQVYGFSDVDTGASGNYTLDWSSSLSGPYTAVSSGSFTGGSVPGNRLLGTVSNSTFPSSGRYFLKLTSRDNTNGLTSVDYNEIEVCGGCAPKPAGMIAWWKFDVSTWPTAVDSVGSNHGSYTGHAVPGYEGYVRDAAGFFARSNDAVHAPAVSPPNFYEMTAEAWVRRQNPVSQGIIASYRATPTRGWELGITSGDTLYFSTNIMTSSVVTHAITTAQFDDFRYHHVAVVVRRVNPNALVPLEIVFYVDGAPLCWGSYCATQFSPSANFPTPSSPEYVLGGGTSLGFLTGNAAFDGNLDEIQVFNTAVSASAIAATAGAGCGGTCN